MLMALGLESQWAQGAVRITLGAENTKEEIDYTVEKLKIVISDMRGVC